MLHLSALLFCVVHERRRLLMSWQNIQAIHEISSLTSAGLQNGYLREAPGVSRRALIASRLTMLGHAHHVQGSPIISHFLIAEMGALGTRAM